MHDLCAHTVTAACGAVSGGVEQDGGPPSARRGGLRPSSMRCVRAPPSRGVPHSGRRGDRGPKPAQATGQNAGRGVPAFKLQCRRAQRVSFVEEPSTTRARAPQKACMSDSGAQLLPHTGRRDNRGGAVFRAETALDVCRNFSICRHTARAPQSATTRCRIGRRVQGGRCHDRGHASNLAFSGRCRRGVLR